jgi:trimethylguanosine synthase
MANHRVTVAGIPDWIPPARLLGDGWVQSTDGWIIDTDTPTAGDILARLRKLVIDGSPIQTSVQPKLKRNAIRQGRLEEARRHRQGSVGFSHKATRTDDEGKFSLTPEKIALSLGKQAFPSTIIDACCGAGGNAIGFARAGCDVTAIELNSERLQLAKHNAKLYHVDHKIRFLQGDALTIVKNSPADLLFIDPPWKDWDRESCSLADFVLLKHLLEQQQHKRTCQQMWAKLPASFNCSSIQDAQPEAIFGTGSGDRHHIKFLLLRLNLAAT